MRGGAFLKGKEERVGFQKRATKLHHRKVAQKMGEGAVRPYIYYLIPCIFFHKANQVLNNGSLNASVG